MTAADLLAGLLRTLEQLSSLSGLGRDRYDADVLLRLAHQRLWTTAGKYAESHRVAAGIEACLPPWSELYSYRSVLAHMLPRRDQ